MNTLVIDDKVSTLEKWFSLLVPGIILFIMWAYYGKKKPNRASFFGKVVVLKIALTVVLVVVSNLVQK